MMKLKYLLTVLVLLISSANCLAVDSFYKNTLKEIDVKKAANDGYLLNLIFNENYTEPLSIIKKGAKKHSIILPETKISDKDVNILYEIDKNDANIEVTQHPYIDKSIQNGYVKIIINTANDVPVHISSDLALAVQPEKISPENIETINQEGEKKIPELPVAVQEKEPEVQGSLTSLETTIPAIKKLKKYSITQDYWDIILKIILIVTVVAFCIRQMYKALKSIKVSIKSIQPKTHTFSPSQTKNYTNSKFKKQLDQINSETSLKQANIDIEEVKSKTNLAAAVSEEVTSNQETALQQKVEQATQTKQTNPIAKDKEESFAENPILISHAKIAKDKGMYLVNYDSKYSLLGYIGDKFFALKTLDNLNKPNLQMRINEKNYGKATYLARIGEYKSLIEVSQTDMRVLTEF